MTGETDNSKLTMMDKYEVHPYLYSSGYSGYYVRIKEDGLTYEMSFFHDSDDYLTFNVCLSVYRKRKEVDDNFEYKRLTGKNIFKSYVFAKNAFDSLYENCAKEHRIIVKAIDDKRARAYESFLKKYEFEKKYIHEKGLSKFIFVKDNRIDGTQRL